jgi:tetratricopeptide (TPR) repeat protein
MTEEPIKVFFSYSHQDEEFKDELVKHLTILQRQGIVAGWHDRMIQPGSEWDHEIDEALDAAEIILLMVSPDFLASDYCWGVEVQQAMQRHEAGEACVIPVILRSVMWEGAPFAKLQPLPKDAEPIASWENRDEAFYDVAIGINVAVTNLRKERQQKQALVGAKLAAEDLFQQGIQKQRQGDNQAAIALYNEAIKLKPDYAFAYNNRGLIRGALGDYQGAIADYEDSLRLENPEPWIVYNNRGLVRYTLGDYHGAIADYDQTIQLKPDLTDAYLGRGLARYASDNHRGAIADYDQALKLKPDSELAYNNRGLARYALKDYQGAIADYDQAIQLKPDFDLAYSNRGLTRYALGDHQGAIADYEYALQFNADYADVYYNRGLLYKQTEAPQAAIADFQKARDLYQQQGKTRDYLDAVEKLDRL